MRLLANYGNCSCVCDKECVENPKHIQRLEELNLDKISDPQNMADITEKVYY